MITDLASLISGLLTGDGAPAQIPINDASCFVVIVFGDDKAPHHLGANENIAISDTAAVGRFSGRELLERLEAILGREGRSGAPSVERLGYTFAGFRLDVTVRQLHTPAGEVLTLTESEVLILRALLDRPHNVVSREELMLLLHGDGCESSGRSVDIHISRLRRKLQEHHCRIEIKTRRGVGYLLDSDVVVEQPGRSGGRSAA